jgi:SprT-like family protein
MPVRPRGRGNQPGNPGAASQRLVEDGDVQAQWQSFRESIADALALRDAHEVFEAVVSFARHTETGFALVSRLLLALYRTEFSSNKLMARWWREGPRALGEGETSSQVALATALREHGKASRDWVYGKALEQLAPWEERINDQFFEGALPPAVISFEPTRARKLGNYRIGHDGLGLLWRININPRQFNRPFAQLIATLAHEKIHQWEHLLCGRWSAGEGYHTKRFQERATAIGIPTNGRGHYLGVAAQGALAHLLAKEQIGLEAPSETLARIDRANTRARPALVAWVCGCRAPVVWVARDSVIAAACTRCEQDFESRGPSR